MGTQPTPVNKTTTLTHPSLPQNISFIERLVLPVMFSLIMGLVNDPVAADNLKTFLLPVRDALNQTYPAE